MAALRPRGRSHPHQIATGEIEETYKPQLKARPTDEELRTTMAAETRKQSTDPTPKRRAKAKPPDARPADDTESSPAMTVTLSERDLANAHDLMAALSLENTDESVSTALNVAARLARMLETPGSRLYLRKSDGTVQGIALVRPRATDA